MTLNEIFEMEKQTSLALKQFKENVVAAVADAGPIPGVTVPDNTNGLKIAYVNFGAIKENNFSLSPETYIPKVQAELVAQAIHNIPTALQTFEKLRELVAKKSVTVSSGSRKYTIQLNANTVTALEKVLSNTGKEVA